MPNTNPFSNLLVTLTLSERSLSRLRSTFQTVAYHPPSSSSAPTADTLKSTDILFGSFAHLPSVKSLDELPNLRHIQLGSAGADGALRTAPLREYLEEGGGGERKGKGVTMSTASGTHVVSIPNWVVGSVIVLYHQIHRMLAIAREQKRWVEGNEVDYKGGVYYARSLHGRTAGMLGYGALGRESARLLRAHGMRIVAANTSGKATPQDGYIVPGTGDQDGSIPDKYYSTKDDASFAEFLKQCDVLVASLPSTKNTKYMLTAERLAMLPKDALFVNVGRGDLIKSDDLLAALDRADTDQPGLYGAALDVTDPEPLPDSHPLWTHPRVLVTPHLSGNAEGEFDIATEVCLYNVERAKRGEGMVNLVEFERGY